MIVFLIFVAVYIVGIIGCLCLTYFTGKEDIETIGDLLDESIFLTYIPVFNIITLIAILVIMVSVWLVTLLKMDKLWKSFRNIKIKK